MLNDFLKKNITSQANYVEYGYGQVEPNHLSAQRTAQIYAQLPANADINVLEQGQFVKYDYGCESGPEVNFTGKGEWMLVYNEIKLYRDHQMDCEFAMVKDNYVARIYSPFGGAKDSKGADVADEVMDRRAIALNGVADEPTSQFGDIEKVTKSPDMYEITYNEDPMHFFGPYVEAPMKKNTTMVPRVFKTNIGDIFTTNTVKFADNGNLPELGGILCVGDDGILTEEAHAGSNAGTMRWQIVKIYTMPDHQRGVKVMRIA